ncbi:hypothetical protein FBU59_001111 [Linderina macrospora]|uniref:Uncharacterized protein n=1 Tax=Linderina macrospora TaxID=4868 RepID=A0ACC1JF17_9FUNG|nr:hypothetical protein FBU59_001111 [Linderina macrospora]
MFGTTLRTVATTALRAQRIQTRGLASSILYVTNLPKGTTEEKLAPIFEKYGPVYEYHFPQSRGEQSYVNAFIKLYSGDLPSTIEELAALPAPSAVEVSDVAKRGSDAIAELSEYDFEGRPMRVGFAHKNMPDAIQFHARMTLRKAADPEFAANTNKRQNEKGGYSAGYKDGFRDGLAEAQKNASA